MYESTRNAAHPTCVVCGSKVDQGLGIQFVVADDGSVHAEFECLSVLEGYPAMLHGGVICMLLDGAMTNSLFARGVVAITVDISVRFRKPVSSQGQAILRARVDSSTSSLFLASAEIVQQDEVKATAKARFVKKPATRMPRESETTP